VAMSKWVLNSGAWLFEQSHLNVLNIPLDDAGMAHLHSLLQTIWSDMDLGFQIRLSGAPDFTLQDGEVGIDARLRMYLRDFGSDKEVLGGTIPVSASFAVGFNDGKLQIDIGRVSVQGITLDDGTCGTITRKTCIFPFTYEGKVYQECTGVGTFLGQHYWCPTKVDEHGIFEKGSSDWGTCSAKCQIVQRAVIPMINEQIESILQTYVHPIVDLRRPLTGSIKDLLELNDTSILVAEGAMRVWTGFSLNLVSWINQHFGLDASRRLTAPLPRSLL